MPLLSVVPDSELTRRDEESVRKEKALDERQNEPVIIGIASHLRRCWDAAQMAKQPIENIMHKAQRQRSGEYEPEKLAAMDKTGGSQIWMHVTATKCRSAEAWLKDVLLDQGSPPWDLQPTPVPELNPEQEEEIKGIFSQKIIQALQQAGEALGAEEMIELQEMTKRDYRLKTLQAAQNRTERMRLKISDQFAEGGWEDAFNDMVVDLATFPAAFIKGPVVRYRRRLNWLAGEDGTTEPGVSVELSPEFERVDPFKIYPEPGITTLDDGYLFEHHRLTSSALSELMDVPGYDSDAIAAVLRQGSSTSWVNPQQSHEQDNAEMKHYSYQRPTEVFDALEYWGKIPGSMLIEWGLDEDAVESAEKHYDANVWIVGNYVIKAVLNSDPLGEKPYVKASFFQRSGAFWGIGIPEMIEDVQAVCNAAARSLVNNMGLSSGPQVVINLERLPPNETIEQMHPWKIWQTTSDPLGNSQKAIEFTQPNSNAEELMRVYEKFAKLADDHSGIPSYLSGDLDVQGAGRTASGLSMLMGAAGKGIRQVVMHIDNGIIKPIVRRQFIYNMRFDEDESIKGDVEVMPRGAVNLAVRESAELATHRVPERHGQRD